MRQEHINGARLAQRFGKYAEERRNSPKPEKRFSDDLEASAEASARQPVHMDNRSVRPATQPSDERRGSAQIASPNESTHKHPPLRLPRHTTAGGQHRLDRFADPKRITNAQAQRLAQYAPHIQAAAEKYQVPVELICGVILQESGANPKATSHAGAQGLMQLMPKTAKRFGVTNSYDPVQNIDGGTRYLRFLLDRFNGDVKLALAGYNAGEGNVEKYGNKIPPFRETQAYVPNVLGYTQSMVDILVASRTPLPTYARRA